MGLFLRGLLGYFATLRYPWGLSPPHCPLRCIVKQAEFQDRPPSFSGLLSIFSRKTALNGFPTMMDRSDPDWNAWL